MKLISHRGNINGKIPLRENEPAYINLAMLSGYDVEIDVWWVDNEFWLGHDEPQYKTTPTFLMNEKFWCHAKNLPAILEMKKYPNIHYFWHQEDDITLTSKGYIWAHPGMQPLSNSIAVLPELYNEKVLGCVGVCSDYVKNFENV